MDTTIADSLDITLRLTSYPTTPGEPGRLDVQRHTLRIRIFADRHEFRAADSKPGPSWSGKTLEDGRVLGVLMTTTGRNNHGEDEPEDPDWVADARAFRGRLLDFIESDPDCKGVTLRTTGNGCAEFGMDVGQAHALWLDMRKDPDY